MRQRTNISGEAARMARAAASNLASLQSALRATQDNLTGLRRALKVPNTIPRRHMIKKSASGGFLLSAAQMASQVSNAASLAQRIL